MALAHRAAVATAATAAAAVEAAVAPWTGSWPGNVTARRSAREPCAEVPLHSYFALLLSDSMDRAHPNLFEITLRQV